MILLIAALKDEVKAILDEMEIEETVHLRPSVIYRGEYLGRAVLVSHAGIGYNRMRRAAAFCISQYRPSLLLNIGYCGGLSPQLALGDIVVAETVIYENGGLNFQAAKPAVAVPSEIRVHFGNILTVDDVIQTPHEKAFLGTKFGAIAVDMESAGLGSSAADAGCTFSVIRSVLDPMDMNLDPMGLVNDDGTSSVSGVISHIIRKPLKAHRLPHLGFCASKARLSLTRFVNEIIKETK